MRNTLSSHLNQLGLLPSDINYLPISHSHDDHLGNANLFADSTFIVNELEYQLMFSDESNTIRIK